MRLPAIFAAPGASPTQSGRFLDFFSFKVNYLSSI